MMGVETAPCWWEGCQGRLESKRKVTIITGPLLHFAGLPGVGGRSTTEWWGRVGTLLALRNDAAWERVK